MNIILNHSSMIPIYEQLVSQIKNQILDGTLKADDALPSVRGLSAQLRISALTVKKSYDVLEKEELVVTVHGKGTYVAQTNLELAMEQRRRSIEDAFAEAVSKARAFGMEQQDILDIVTILLEDEPQ